MSIPVPHLSYYLVEWYRPELDADPLEHTAAALDECAASLSADGCPVQLLMTLAVPTDEVVFGVFEAGSADIVAQACQRAGIPAARLSVATPGRLARRS
jgi:hypothetical protein